MPLDICCWYLEVIMPPDYRTTAEDAIEYRTLCYEDCRTTTIGSAAMSAQIVAFPAAASPMQRAVAGCMHACWTAHSGAPVDIEAIGRLYRHLVAHRPGHRDAARILRQLQAGTGWLLEAHRSAVVTATADGETTGADGDAAASRACDLVGALGLLAMCGDALQPQFAAMTGREISDAWEGLHLDVG